MNHRSLVDGDLRQPVAAGIARLVDYRAGHRQPGARPPLLSTLHGFDVPALASGFVTCDAAPFGEGRGFQFRCREMGPRHRAFVGRDLTGKTLEDVFDHDDARFFSNIHWGVLTTGRPRNWRRPSAMPGRESETYDAQEHQRARARQP
jgi:hypothetical protein